MAERGQINWLGLLLLPIAIPAALVAGLLPWGKTQSLSAAEVARSLREFLDGSGGDYDWDDFISVPLTDPELEQIRLEAESVALPLQVAGRVRLEDLLERAEALARR